MLPYQALAPKSTTILGKLQTNIRSQRKVISLHFHLTLIVVVYYSYGRRYCAFVCCYFCTAIRPDQPPKPYMHKL